jgi:hypothetical protein
MKERPKIECRALYCIARIEGRQMVRVRQFPDPLYWSFVTPSVPQHGASAASSGFAGNKTDRL